MEEGTSTGAPRRRHIIERPRLLELLDETSARIVLLVAPAGYSNEEIGARLGISARTAKAHADVLRHKLGVPRRRQIPHAYRTLTGDDPLAKDLEPASVGEGG